MKIQGSVFEGVTLPQSVVQKPELKLKSLSCVCVVLKECAITNMWALNSHPQPGERPREAERGGSTRSWAWDGETSEDTDKVTSPEGEDALLLGGHGGDDLLQKLHALAGGDGCLGDEKSLLMARVQTQGTG